MRPVRGIYSALVVALCAVCLAAALVRPPDACAASAKKRQLLGSMEFKGKLQKLPKWTRVLDKMKAWKGYFRDAQTNNHPSKRAWNTLKAQVKDKSEMERLKAVSKFFNKWPYRLDKANWGVSEYWETPWEFLKKSGDCEDYSIAKFYALQELGFTGDQLRIVAVKDAIRGIGHAVLAVYATDDIYILDNQTNMVLSHTKYRHYIPQYSVNEHYRWMHVAPKKRTTYQKAKQ
jgi:predicted transglutaminase-like cysteine proteinase